ncbi:MAG: type II toxin-antitoxin system VapC family toxin [Spirochaetales bacterium]
MKPVLVDSSVVLDVFTRDASFYDRSVAVLTQWGATHDLCINAIVYAETAAGFNRIERLNEALDGAGFSMRDIPREALFLAAKAFLGYRRRGGVKTSPLPDFIIGAHAAVEGLPLITRDPKRVRSEYPSLNIIEP